MREMTEILERGAPSKRREPRQGQRDLQLRLAELEESNATLVKALEESNSALRILESYNKQLEDDLKKALSKKRRGGGSEDQPPQE